MLLLFSIIFAMIGIGFDRIQSLYITFLYRKNTICTNTYLYDYAKDAKKLMRLNYKVLIAINENKTICNARVGVSKNNIYIIVYGKWSKESLKFVIGHELAHIKLCHHRESHLSIFYLICIASITLFTYDLTTHIRPSSDLYTYKDLLLNFILLIYAIITYVYLQYSKKTSRNNENKADLLAAKITGLTAAISAIRMLNDKTILSIKTTHPNNNQRIDYLLTHIKG